MSGKPEATVAEAGAVPAHACEPPRVARVDGIPALTESLPPTAAISALVMAMTAVAPVLALRRMRSTPEH